MQIRLLTLAFPIMIVLSATAVMAQTPTFQSQPYIYRIKVEGCKHAPFVRRQTGFLVRGRGGIVTALHGVADCPEANIRAESVHGDFTVLTMSAVDVDRDVAFLTSSELATKLDEGLEAPDTESVSREGLYAIGYPYGKTNQEPTTQISVTYGMTLNQLIPGEFITRAFEDRRSPNLEIRVLLAEAHFVPGHSGAPVLNGQKQVIGMVDGGLKEGYIGKSWLIPWPDVDLQPVDNTDVKEQLNELVTKDIATLAFFSTYPVQTQDDTPSKPLVIVNISICYANWDCRTAELSALVFGGTAAVQLSQAANLNNGFPPNDGLCKFSFLILDSATELPVNRAYVTVLLGSKRKTGYTLGDGSFESSIPCLESNPSVEVHTNANSYKPDSQLVTLVGNIEKVYLMPLALPITTQPPTPTSQVAIPITPTATLAYLCEAEIVSSTSADSVNTLRAKPSATSPLRGAVAVGTKVLVTQKVEEIVIWYRVTQMDGSSLGWIPAENLHLLTICPK